MLKKITALGLIFIASYIALPFGYGLWNENIGVQGLITFAESAKPEQTKAAALAPSSGEEASVPESVNVSSDEQLVSGQSLSPEEPSIPEQTQEETTCADSGSSSEPENKTPEESGAPLAVEPVMASENTMS